MSRITAVTPKGRTVSIEPGIDPSGQGRAYTALMVGRIKVGGFRHSDSDTPIFICETLSFLVEALVEADKIIDKTSLSVTD